jgi:hypothetical protein
LLPIKRIKTSRGIRFYSLNQKKFISKKEFSRRTKISRTISRLYQEQEYEPVTERLRVPQMGATKKERAEYHRKIFSIPSKLHAKDRFKNLINPERITELAESTKGRYVFDIRVTGKRGNKLIEPLRRQGISLPKQKAQWKDKVITEYGYLLRDEGYFISSEGKPKRRSRFRFTKLEMIHDVNVYVKIRKVR